MPAKPVSLEPGVRVNGNHGNMETRLLLSKWDKERKEHRGQVGAAAGLREGQPLNLASDAVGLPWVRDSMITTLQPWHREQQPAA